MDTSNPHQLFAALGLLPAATEREVKTAYRKLALMHHPDKGTSSDLEKIKLINIAYSEIMERRLYRVPRPDASKDENEPWFEFTQPWKPTPEEFREFNDECIAAYVQRYDDEIREVVRGFGQLTEDQRGRVRSRFKTWLNSSRKKPFEPYPPPPSPPKEPVPRPTLIPRTRNIHVRQRLHSRPVCQSEMSWSLLDVTFAIFIFILVTMLFYYRLISPETVGTWLLCIVVIIACAPLGWTNSLFA